MFKVISRYLAREVFVTLVALTAILLLIFMSNQCVQYLNRAASGQIPGIFILKLMMLEMPNLIGLLLPLGFYIALILTYGRLYVDNEMTALFAGGYSQGQLLRTSLVMASFIALIVGILMFWMSPWIAIERAYLIKNTGIKTIIQTLAPGRFKALQNGQLVFYVEAMNREHDKAKHIFLARRLSDEAHPKWDIVFANQAYGKLNQDSQEEALVLKDGGAYMGIPGQAAYQVAYFKMLEVRLPHPETHLEADIRTWPTKKLLPLVNNQDVAKVAELQWRLSVPLMTIILTLIAVPLSYVNPRSGKYAQLLPAILIYIVYANFMFVARAALVQNKIPVWIGMWWLHILMLGIALLLLWYRGRQIL